MILLLEAEGAAAIPPKERVKEGAAPGSGEPAGYGSSAGVYETIEVKVPDIGDFKDVPVIEVHVAEGATVKAEDPLLTLESDKATMDVPSPAAGTVAGSRSRSATGWARATLILLLQTGEAKPAAPRGPRRRPPTGARRPSPRPPARATSRRGPGAGRRPRRLHRRLPRRRPRPAGGAGRALADPGRGLPQRRLHPLQGAAARRQGDRRDQGDGPHGIGFAEPEIDLDQLRGWKDGVVKKLTGGLAGLAKARKVTTSSRARPVHLAQPARGRAAPTAARRR